MAYNPAKAVTDGHGRVTFDAIPSFKTEFGHTKTKKDPWDIRIHPDTTRHIGDLISDRSPYHLIGYHLLNEQGYQAGQKCLVAKSGIVRCVVIDGKEYRSDCQSLLGHRKHYSS